MSRENELKWNVLRAGMDSVVLDVDKNLNVVVPIVLVILYLAAELADDCPI